MAWGPLLLSPERGNDGGNITLREREEKPVYVGVCVSARASVWIKDDRERSGKADGGDVAGIDAGGSGDLSREDVVFSV